MSYEPEMPATVANVARLVLEHVRSQVVRQTGRTFSLRAAWKVAARAVAKQRGEWIFHPSQRTGAIHLGGGYAMAMVLIEREAEKLTPDVPAGHAAEAYASDNTELSVAVVAAVLATLESEGEQLAQDFIGPKVLRAF